MFVVLTFFCLLAEFRKAMTSFTQHMFYTKLSHWKNTVCRYLNKFVVLCRYLNNSCHFLWSAPTFASFFFVINVNVILIHVHIFVRSWGEGPVGSPWPLPCWRPSSDYHRLLSVSAHRSPHQLTVDERMLRGSVRSYWRTSGCRWHISRASVLSRCLW